MGKEINRTNTLESKNIIDKFRNFLAYFTWAAIFIGTGMTVLPETVIAGQTLLGLGLGDLAGDKTVGKQISSWWEDLKGKIKNVYDGRQCTTANP